MQKIEEHIYIGIDPGLTRCGWAVISNKNTDTLLQEYGVFQTKKDEPQEFRLLSQFNSLENLFLKYKALCSGGSRVHLSIERPFFTIHNPDTAFGTAQIVGFAMALAAKYGFSVSLVTPKEAKLASTGNGNANKSQITTAVQKLFALKTAPKPADAADAIAIAYCLYKKPFLSLLGALTDKNTQTETQKILSEALKSSKTSGLKHARLKRM